MNSGIAADLSEVVARDLPFLRRYARALTGSQQAGDGVALSALEAILADPGLITQHVSQRPRVALFGVFQKVWETAGAHLAEPDSRLSAAAQGRLSGLANHAREALLMRTIEGFSYEEIALVLDTDAAGAAGLVDQAFADMDGSMRGSILIIEDEAIIAMDIASIVEGMGHRVTGVARTRSEALAEVSRERPDLVLADIQLADHSSGVDAVNDILSKFDDLPVIFVTAFPERLLTGERPEPAFLINKPYTEEQVRSAVSQALFFASTETLQG